MPISEIKNCAFCGSPAEKDYMRGYSTYPGGRLDHGAAIYCTACNADMMICRSDTSELSDEERMAILEENWNRRAAVGAVWTCAARKQGTAGGNDPADCNWPMCGCDPVADKVIAALQEAGAIPASPSDAERHESAVPDGWQLVPKEPTWGLDAMSGAGAERIPAAVAQGYAGRMSVDVYKAMLAAAPPPPAAVQEPVDVKARAFDMIVAARKVHVDAVAAYNARLELVRAERLRGNWQLNTDQEFKATSEAQSSLFRIVKDLCDNALSTSQSDPVPEASLGGSDEPYWCVNGKLYPRRKTIETSLASLERHIREAIEEHGESPRFSWLEKDARDIRAALSTTATDGE